MATRHIALARFLTLLISSSFVLHVMWEYAHIGLYTGYSSLEGILPVWVFATVGDVAYTILALGVVTLFKQDYQWVHHPSFRDYVGLSFLGFGVALLVEYKALALQRWAYLATMPLVPFLGIGASPVLQMTLLLPLSVYLTALLYSKS